jgi:hypothetical protein
MAWYRTFSAVGPNRNFSDLDAITLIFVTEVNT